MIGNHENGIGWTLRQDFDGVRGLTVLYSKCTVNIKYSVYIPLNISLDIINPATWTASRNWYGIFVDVALHLGQNTLFGEIIPASRPPKFRYFRKLSPSPSGDLFFDRIKKVFIL